jgi:hypothetical protein
MDLADGVDEETWLYHLRRGEVSQWLRTSIKDEGLADSVAMLERNTSADAAKTRKLVREFIEERYTLPAEEGVSA